MLWELLDQVVTKLFMTIRSTSLFSSQLKLSEKVNKDNYTINHIS